MATGQIGLCVATAEKERKNAARPVLRSCVKGTMDHIIVVWICPQCGNYYGASSAEDLDQMMNYDKKGSVVSVRTQCPNCHSARVRCVFSVELVLKEEARTNGGE